MSRYYICWEKDNQIHCEKTISYKNALETVARLVESGVNPDDINVFSEYAAIKL